MPTTVGQHSVATFTSPLNGTTPIDANTVRGNDNTIRSAYVTHDADPGIHLQSSTLAFRPAASVAGRKWITADAGSYRLWYDDGTRWHEVGGDSIELEVIADATLVKGDVVMVTGFNNAQNVATVNKYNGTAPAFGIASEGIASGGRGYIINTGYITGIATDTFGAVGTILYPAATGTFTATKPTSGNYQVSAYVLESSATTGVLFVEFSATRIVERSDNTASTIVLRDASGNFAAGTITAGALTSTGLVTFASLKGTGATTVTNILDEDNMASDSSTALATQQSIKAYVDSKVASVDTLAEVLANGNTTGANNIIVTAGQKITTNTIDETTSGAGVTIDSVLLKDDVVNATDIETGTISANDGTLAVTVANSTGALTLASALADTNLATISTAGKVANSATTATATNTNSAIVARDGSGNFSAGTITATLNGAAPAGSLSGNTLASGVTASSLTSVGTLTSLTVSGDLTVDTSTLKVDAANNRVGILNTTPTFPLDVAGPINSATGSAAAAYKINGTDVLTATTLGSGVTASSLTSVGTLSALTVSGAASIATGVASQLAVFGANNTTDKYITVKNSGGDLYVGSSATATYLWNVANTPMQFYTNNVNRMTIDASGNVLVNTTTPALSSSGRGLLEVNGSTTSLYGLKVGDTAYGYLAASATQTELAAIGASQPLLFTTNSGERMRITPSGNVGIGTTPSAWDTSIFRTMQIGTGAGSASLSGRADGSKDLILASNLYYATGNFRYVGTGTATMYRMDGATHSWGYAASGTAGNAATLTQAMTLDASGNVGIGTTSPAGRLEVVGGDVFFSNATGDRLIVSPKTAGNGTKLIGVNNANSAYANVVLAGAVLRFESGGETERARITSGGYFKASNNGLYFNSTSSIHEFRTSTSANEITHNTHTASSSPYGVRISYTAASPNGTDNWFLYCDDSTALRAEIRSNGGLANYSANNVNLASDERLKKDIAPLASTWDKLKAIEVVNFRYKDCNDGDPALYGVIAQQVQPIVPELVVVTREAVEAKEAVLDDDGNEVTPAVDASPEYYGIREQPMYWLAIKALQEAQSRIESLEARLAALESH